MTTRRDTGSIAPMIYALVIAMLLAGFILVVGYAGRDPGHGPDSSPKDKS